MSLKKDRRNAYGENDKAARKGIPLRKAKANRAVRRGVKTALGSGKDEIGGIVKALEEARWRKVPDAALEQLVRTGKEKHEQSYRARAKRWANKHRDADDVF